MCCKAALHLEAEARHGMHVFSIPNILGSKTICREYGYCCPQRSLGSNSHTVDEPGASCLALLLSWDRDGDGQELGCPGSPFCWDRLELPSQPKPPNSAGSSQARPRQQISHQKGSQNLSLPMVSTDVL